MGLNSYQETIIHDRIEEGWGESSVFRVRYPDGRQECIKEYKPGMSYQLLKDYHNLHNELGKKSFEYSTDFVLDGQQISTLKFSVLSLGHTLSKVSSLVTKEESCVVNVPYIGGISFDEIGLRSSIPVYSILLSARNQFIADLVAEFPFLREHVVKLELCNFNMKYIVEEDVMSVVVTDLCGRIGDLYDLFDTTQEKLFETLHTTPQHVTQ